MKIHVPSIPDSGKTISMTRETPWIQEILRERIENHDPESVEIRGDLEIYRVNDNVTLKGQLEIKLGASCDRCTEDFPLPMSLDLSRHLTPFFDNPENTKDTDEEVELQVEDLGFSCYHGEEIDLADFVAEEILLALPMRLLCREDCLGLCDQCGANLNKNPCKCEGENSPSPFDALKDVKIPSQQK